MAFAPRTLEAGEDFDDFDDFLTHIHIHLLASNLTKALAPPIAQLLTDLQGHRTARQHLAVMVATLEARKIFLDDGLDHILDDVKTAFAGDASPESAALYADKDIFGDESPSAVRRYVLGPQLEKMRSWPGKLGGSTNPKLKELGVKTQQIIPDIDKLLQDIGAAQVALETFDLGPRTAFTDQSNAAIKLVFGQLSELAHNPPGGPLPEGFVDRFFLRDTSGRAPRIQGLEKAVQRTRDKLKRQEQQLQELRDKRAKELRDKQDAELAEMTARAEAAKKAADKAAAMLAEIQAEIAKKKPS